MSPLGLNERLVRNRFKVPLTACDDGVAPVQNHSLAGSNNAASALWIGFPQFANDILDVCSVIRPALRQFARWWFLGFQK